MQKIVTSCLLRVTITGTVCVIHRHIRGPNPLKCRSFMSVAIPDEFSGFVRDSIASGRFRSADEVVAEALRLLKHREQKLDALRRDIQEGLDSLKEHPAVPLDVEDIIRRGQIRLAQQKQGSNG